MVAADREAQVLAEVLEAKAPAEEEWVREKLSPVLPGPWAVIKLSRVTRSRLRGRVLENGKVGEVQIEQSAGHPDLDMAVADAVRRWLFEPARMGKQSIAVWVLLPVKFELH